MLAADGELSARRAEQIRKHLAGCRECCARAQELAGAIGEFVHLYRHNLDPLLPPPSGSRALLKARLDAFASSDPSWWGLPPAWRQRLIPIGTSIFVLVVASFLVPRPWTSRRQVTSARFLPMSFPAAELTPGVARPKTRDQVCGSNEGKNRGVSPALRRKVFELYGMPGADPDAYEVDYLITPALGGADDIGNLWPQPYSSTIWNARVKDALEDRLRDLVCRGDVDLATAQREISTNWIAAYKKYFHAEKPVN